jgi:hypothetical protein
MLGMPVLQFCSFLKQNSADFFIDEDFYKNRLQKVF